jgi:hypothetical protein
MNKYRNVKTEVDGIVFDSKKEARRYGELTTLQAAGEISRLMLQPKFDIIVNGVKVTYYKADFAYFNKDERVIEDVKGVKTPVYRLKKKLVEALYPGVKIEEV